MGARSETMEDDQTPIVIPMIIWINGTFGVGKTTTAGLVAETPNWRTFDPEQVGYLLAGHLKDLEFDDFQDLPPWRALVPTVADEIISFTGCSALVAMQTVLVQSYWEELRRGLEQRDLPIFHVILDCNEEELRSRIENDEVEHQAKDWRLDHIAKYHEAREWLARSADIVIDTTHSKPSEVAEVVIAAANDRIAAQAP